MNANKDRAITEVIEFKVDALGALGPNQGRDVFQKLLKAIRDKNNREVVLVVAKFRRKTGIRKAPKGVIKPQIARTKVRFPKAKETKTDVMGDFINADFFGYGDIPPVEAVVPVPDVAPPLGDLGEYPYDTQVPIPDFWQPTKLDRNPIRRSRAGEKIYPYQPSNAAPEPKEGIIRGVGELGTLLPPRPVLKPWRKAIQQLFHAGDIVISKVDHRVGRIKYIRGVEATIIFENGEWARMPIQDLAIYHGTVRKLKQVEARATEDLSKMVGRNPQRS